MKSKLHHLKDINRVSYPKWLRPIVTPFFKIQHFLGLIINPILLVIFYYFFVTPIGMAFRLFSGQSFKTQKKREQSSWVYANNPKVDIKRQF